MTIAPKTLAWLHQSAAVDGAAYSQVLLSLLERVEELEAALRQSTVKESLAVPPTPEAAPVATDEELFALAAKLQHFATALRACYNLGRQHGAAQPPAAQPTPPAAPVWGLVERVEDTITGEWHQNSREAALSAIGEVAYFLGDLGYRAAKADLLEQVANA